MFKTSYTHEVRKEKYERSEVFDDDPKGTETSGGTSATQGWASLQELNSRFARYINRARILEQRNAVFRKQLETLRRTEEAGGPEEAFSEQVEVNRQRIRELTSEHVKLQRELKEACSMLDDYTTKYRNEREYQEQLRNMLEQLNKEADDALLKKMELQIQSQFLQDDISATKDRHRKDLAEIETYVSILQQINQTTALLPGVSEEQEKLRAQRRVPGLQSQLEEYKSTLCQLQAQKQRLQNETSLMEQAIKSTQEHYDDEIQTYNEQIESLRKQIEEAERSLERYTSECRRVAMYQTSQEKELERYKRIIENEDSRLNSAILGTPITLFTTNYHYTHTPTAPSRGRDITQAIQDITSIKPRQKHLAKKVTKKKESMPEDVKENIHEEKPGAAPPGEAAAEERRESTGEETREEVNKQEQRPTFTGASPQDVPDGAQISKAFDTLCDIVRQRMRRSRKPEPIADFCTKGRYVLVTGEGSYLDPCFSTSSPSAGHVYITIRDGWGPPYHMPSPPPSPQPLPGPSPPDPTLPSNGEGGTGVDKSGRGKDGAKGKHQKGEPHPRPKDPAPSSSHSSSFPSPGPRDPSPRPGDDYPSGPKGSRDPPMPPPRGAGASLGSSFAADSMRYEMVEMVESVERFCNDHKMKGYEETSMVVETTIEKSSKKKH